MSVLETESGHSFPGEKSFPQIPTYIILFEDSANAGDMYSPIWFSNEPPSSFGGTLPHGLDSDLVPCLPVLWYCLHMPAQLLDMRDCQARHLKEFQDYDLPHEIALIPASFFAEYIRISKALRKVKRPVVLFVPDSLIDLAETQSVGLEMPIQIVPFSSLAPTTVRGHWEFVRDTLASNVDYLGREPALTERLDVAPRLLPVQLLLRQLGGATDLPLPDDAMELGGLTLYGLRVQSFLSAIASLERQGLNKEQAEALLPKTMDHEAQALRVPVSIASPGVPPAYIRDVYKNVEQELGNGWPILDSQQTRHSIGVLGDDQRNERAAIDFAITHRAIARHGLGLSTGTVTPQLFQLLTDLERHCAENTRPNVRAIRRWLGDIGTQAASLFDDGARAAAMHASFLNVFSNFPLGLAVLPGGTAPLACRVPIAYRPLMPLTRAIQVELSNPPLEYWGSGLKLLIVECIRPDDPVGKASRGGWSYIMDVLKSHTQIEVNYREADSPAGVRSALSELKPDALVLSAHGYYNQRAKHAGILVGNQRSLGLDLGDMPPLVVLSACHVAPRGIGALTISDLLIRQGALAVLGTLVPVDVQRNAVLMTRFFIYLLEAMNGRSPHSTLADIWHHTATSNAVNDILSSNASILRWSASHHDGKSIIEHFMLERSVGRLSRSNIYDDTEAILRELAVETGVVEKFDNWMQNTGYIPETLFYCMMGWPERIVVQNSQIEELRKE